MRVAIRSPVTLLACFFLASWFLAGWAQASYGQMRLDGAGLVLIFVLVVLYGLFIDAALVIRLFRSRTAVFAGTLAGLLLVGFILGLAASPVERPGFFKAASNGFGGVLFVVTSAVFLPFIVAAPVAQYRSLRHGRRWPRWITAWFAVQLAIIPAFIVLGENERRIRQQEFAAGQAAGRYVQAGDLSRILEQLEQRPERIWGTGLTAWERKPAHEVVELFSGWRSGLARGIDASALVAANEPLSAPDRAALLRLVQYFWAYGAYRIHAKLLWDTLEPGRFSRQLAPSGVGESNTVADEVLPALLERLEKYGALRLCPGGRMLDEDRAVLTALVQAKGRAWNVATRTDEMRPEWAGYLRRVEALCRP